MTIESYCLGLVFDGFRTGAAFEGEILEKEQHLIIFLSNLQVNNSQYLLSSVLKETNFKDVIFLNIFVNRLKPRKQPC